MRWIQAVIATALWAFVVTGVAGLLEAAAQWLRFGAPDGVAGESAIRILAPAFTLYGWLGLVTALACAVPLAVFYGRRERAKRRVFGLALGGAAGLVVVVWAGYLVHETPAWLWWTDRVGTGLPLKLLLWAAVALPAARLFERLADVLVHNPRRNLFLPVVIVVVATALWPDWRDEARRDQVGHLERTGSLEASPDGPDVVLITVDTLRRDKLSCVSESAPSTPALDALAADGLLFTNAWTVSSWTLPGMGTILTGMTPRALGVTPRTGLPESAPTLAEAAWRAGWRTAAVAANPYLGYEYGFERGFESFDHTLVLEPLAPAGRSVLVREVTRYVLASSAPNDAERLIGRARRWLAAVPDDRPFLLWVHMMDPHLPYRLHADDPDRPQLPDHPWFADDRFFSLPEIREAEAIPADVATAVEALYDGEVRHADRWIGALLDDLRASNRYDDTLIVVLSDHGEEFFEHGGFEHGHTLMPEVSGVPLVVKLPGGREAGTRIDGARTLLDLVPSLCAEAGWRRAPGLPGSVSLWAPPGASAEEPTSLSVLENMLYGGPSTAWLRWPDFRLEQEDVGPPFWYRLDIDPEALAPAGAPPDGEDLRGRVRTLQADQDALAEQLGAVGRNDLDLSGAARRQLEALGY